MTTRGKFIVLEGIDGAGKTEQCARLAGRLRALGLSVRETREPTAGPYGVRFRERKQARENEEPPFAEEFVMLTLLDRLGHGERIRAWLDRSIHVVCDRYESSTWAYQGAIGIPDAMLDMVMRLARPVPRDLELLLALPTPQAIERATKRQDGLEWWSRQVAKLEEIQKRYIQLGLPMVDAARSPEEVEEAIWQHVQEMLERKEGGWS